MLGTLTAAVALVGSAAVSGCQPKPGEDCGPSAAYERKTEDPRCRIARPGAADGTASPAPPAPSAPPKPGAAVPDRLTGVPLEELTAGQRALFWSVVADQFDPCGKPRSFGDTLLGGRPEECPLAWRLARWAARQAKAGAERSDLVVALVERLRRENSPATFRTEGRPRTGPADPVATVVEFYDYECPYCRELEPRAEELRRRLGDVAFVWKQCPIEGHLTAEPASRAALAAQQQGRFAEMHRALFARGVLDDAGIEAAARDAGLDATRFREDRASEAVARLLQEDSEDADRAAVEGTPSFFVNGVAVPFDELEEQIRELRALRGAGTR